MTGGDRTWKLIDLLETTVTFFKKNDIESSRVDAELLLADLLGKQRIELYASFDQPLTKGEVDAYRERVRRRSRGEPVQRIVGETEFYSLKIKLLDGVFIPRPETELLVDAALAWIQDDRGGTGIAGLDAGTGTGAIAVAISANSPGSSFVAVDRNPAAVSCAAGNAAYHGLSDRILTKEGDCVELMAREEHAFDLVVSNPPYISTAEMEELPREVKLHDPHLALHGGEDGLDLYRSLIPAAATALRENGALFLEVSDTVCPGVLKLMKEQKRFSGVTLQEDYSGHQRVVCGRTG